MKYRIEAHGCVHVFDPKDIRRVMITNNYIEFWFFDGYSMSVGHGAVGVEKILEVWTDGHYDPNMFKPFVDDKIVINSPTSEDF